MKKTTALLLACLLCLSILLTGCGRRSYDDTVFGDFTTTDIDGQPVDPSVFVGHKLSMVNIWGTFCAPCINEMPELAQLEEAYDGQVQVIGMIVDGADRNGTVIPQQKDYARQIIAATGADYLHLMPSKSLNTAYLNRVQSVPETIFLDADGRQVGQSYVGARSLEQWMQIIDMLLEEMQ